MYAASPALAASPPVLITLFTGLLIAFAIQLLLTTFGVAAGITAIGYLPDAQPNDEAQDAASSDAASEKNSRGGTAGTLGFAIGAGTLFTVNTVLFAACFLAVKLSFVSSPAVGAVLGIVIWSGYFLVLLWLSSKAAGSLLGVLVGAVSAGVQGLMATVTTALGRTKAADVLPAALNKRLEATETSLTTLQERQAETDRNLEATLREYVQTIQPPKPDLQVIRQAVTDVLAASGLSAVAKTGLSRIDRQTLVELVSSRTDFSTRDVNNVVEQLEGVWQDVVGAPNAIADLTTFFQAASPETLTPETINDRLQHFLAAKPHVPAENPAATGAHTSQLGVSLEPKQLIKQLARIVRDRVDLSDLDVGSILQQFQTFARSSSESEDSTRPETDDHEALGTTIQADVEDYLLNAYPWNLTRKTVQAEFSDVLYDPEANPTAVRHQLSALDRDFFVTRLEQRDDLSPAKVQKIADRLEATRQTVLDTLNTAIAEAPLQAFSQQVADYLQSASEADLKPPHLQEELQARLKAADVALDRWSDYLRYLSHDRLVTLLHEQQSWDQSQLKALIAAFETSRDRLLEEVQTRQLEAKTEAVALWDALGTYVSDRTQKLTARTMQRQLKALVKTSKIDRSSLQPYLPSFDRAIAAQWLDHHPTLTEKQRQRILAQLEKAWNYLYAAPETATTETSSGSQVLKLLQDYVQTIDPATVKMADLPQDLLHYLKQHHIGFDRLHQFLPSDWKPLLEYVQQRPDLTDAQRHHLQQQVQRSLYMIAKLPRRLALRSKRQAQRWQDHLSDYLRYAERDDLSPDRLSQSIQHLLDRVQTSAGDTFDWQHLTTLSRDRLVALLSEREDLTKDDLNHIVERIETTVQQAIAQAQTVQQQAQEAIAHTLEQLRHHITSVPLPELDYDRIKDDLQRVLVDPRAGLESLSSSLGDTLRDQLSTLNRETLTALIGTRDDLSATFTQQITDRLDAARLGAIAHIETIQQSAKHRLEDLQQQAQHQANATRKAIAIAAWWLFATALSAALTSAIAGALAVGGLEWVQQMVRVLSFE